MDARRRVKDEIARKIAAGSGSNKRVAQHGNKQPSWQWLRPILLSAIVAALVSVAILYLFPLLLSSVTKSSDEGVVREEVNKAMRKHPPALNKALLARLTASTPQELKKMQFKAGGKFIRKVVAEREPVLVQNAPIQAWSSYHWDLLRMAKKHPQLHLNATRVQIKEPVFVLTHERERGGMLGSHKDRPMFYTNVSIELFLREALNENKYFFWTGEVLQWEKETGIDVTTSSKHEETGGNNSSSSSSTSSSWRAFRVVEKGLSKSIDEDDVSLWRPMLWLAHPGTVAAMHYDTSHNFIVQVQGFTRFLILAPDAETHLYPNIHVSYRQSQVAFEEPRNVSASSSSIYSASFPLLKGGSAVYEVQLGPGEVLYVPPYFHYRMECITLSLSLSINSPSIVEAALSEAYWQQVPFGAFQSSEDHRVVAVTAFLTLLVEGGGGDSSAPSNLGLSSSFTLSQLARHLYTSRFLPLVVADAPAKFIAQKCFNVTSKAFGYEVQLEEVARKESQSAALLLEQNKEAFHKASTKIRELLSEAPTNFLSVRQTWLLDYIEQLSRFAVGPKAVGDFISLCLATK